MNVYLIVIVAYFAFVTLISLVTKKAASKSAASFLIAGRNLGVITCAIVVAAEWLGGMSTIGVSEKAFKTGTLQPILYNIATAAGMIIIGFTVARHYRERGVFTVSEMFRSIFGSKCQQYSAYAFLIAYITLAFVQLQTCASVVAPLFNINWTWAVIISSAIITIYTYIGGMHALAITGIIHLTAMFLGLGVALVVGFIDIVKLSGSLSLGELLIAKDSPIDWYNPFSFNFSEAFSLLLGGVLGGMAGQASIQPIFAAKDAPTAKKAAVLSGFIVAPFGIIVGLLALFAKTGLFFDPDSIKNAKMILPTLLTNENFINPILGGIALSGILAAILSTVAPVNFAVVTIAAKDIYHAFINKNADDKKVTETAKQLVILVNFITIPLAIIMKGEILDTAYISYAIRSIGAIVLIFGLYKKNWISANSVKLAFIGGSIVTLVFVVLQKYNIFDFDKTYAAIISALIFITIGNLYSTYKYKQAKQ